MKEKGFLLYPHGGFLFPSDQESAFVCHHDFENIGFL